MLGSLLIAVLTKVNASERVSVEKSLLHETVYFPGNVSGTWRSEYAIKLLAMALNKAEHTRYRLRPSEVISPRTRNFSLLYKNKGIDVLWSMTRKSREQKYRPIRIPIFMGLSGWRIPLVHSKNSKVLEDVTTLEELKRLSVGQMHAWTDTKILRASGFSVDSGPSYESMFRMLAARRFDYFPRSVIEAVNEAKEHNDSGIVIDNNIAIHYPAAIYFFVNKNNAELALAIEQGLEKLIAEGSFRRLFIQHHEEFLRFANIPGRKIFHLSNPMLPESTPLHRRELWLDPRSEG